jgi:gluconate 2-dehydrogenase gamma chain
MKRREFITLPARSLGGALLYTLAHEPRLANAQEGVLRIPLRFFTRAEAEIVTAVAERIFPADQSGPGATEAGVVIYIDRQLAGPYGRDQFRYTKGPWVESLPEHGYQGKETPREIYRAALAQLAGFAALPAAEQDAKLHTIESTVFFQLLRRHTLEGMFCDPHHGGNANMIGWQLIGYPGPRMSYRDEIGPEANPPKRSPISLSDALGHPVKGWEDE